MTTPALSESRLANIAARTVEETWGTFTGRFTIITRRARLRFENRDWPGLAADHLERLDLYNRAAADTARMVASVLGERLEDRAIWTGMKAVYSGLIQTRPDWELAETFFNSVTRRLFSTVGVDPLIEFVDTDFDTPPAEPPAPVVLEYREPVDTASLVRRMIGDAGFTVPFRSLDKDCRLAADLIDQRLRRVGALGRIDRAELVSAPFFRGKGAYLIGRLWSGSQTVPLVLALLHPADGVVLDAVLLTENQVSILFSFTRSYFHVDVASPHPLVHLLSALMPRKRRSELYISLGHNKHGKTELYRELRRHLALSGERFEVARGTRGLVMEVFTLPGFDMVAKVIKDRFGAPKQLTRTQVMNRYRLVFRHDRAGRLVDAQEYEHLTLPRSRFGDDVLELLTTECGRSVTVDGEAVAIAHLYVERRVTPLDVYLAEAGREAAEAAVIDFGQSIKDMAASGIFPGDMLLKNFGVTRHGRVVFYDYDELTLLEECRFRDLPDPAGMDEALAPEPWFPVGPDDVFPQELETFLGLQGELRRVFMAHHSDLFSAATWRRWQERVRSGEIIEIFPYQERERLRPGLGV